MAHQESPGDRTLKTFLSYPRERISDAEKVHRFLASVGVENWWDQESLVGGDDWDRERHEAQRAADLFLLICSAETFGRGGVIQREIKDALDEARDRKPGDLYIVNLRSSEVSLPQELARYQWIDLFATDWKSRLARTVERAIRQRALIVPDTLAVALATAVSGDVTPILVEEDDSDGDRYVSYFQYTGTGDYWNYVNAEITARALGTLYQARRKQADWKHQDGTGYLELTLSEFHRAGELVSLIIAESSYYSGMAHPNHSVTALNIFGSKAGIIEIGELFDHEPKAFNLLREYVDLDLKRQGVELGEQPLSLSRYAETYGWNLFAHFNVNERGMILNFSSAAGLPHVLGFLEVYVPWEWVQSFVSPTVQSFLERNGVTVR